MPADSAGTADAVLFIRALHNLARFESKGDYMTKAIQAAYKVLKPGGIVGVVQHEARNDRPDDWANGDNGYLKKRAVIAAMQAAGFEFIDESDVNANEKDQADVGDFVWRLPPSLNGAGEDEELKAKMEAIGESNRMTLKFRKPASS
jgi:predicted methyltransferase